MGLSRIRIVEGNATGIFQATGEAGFEGIVIKRKDALYQQGKRSWSWQKVINWKEAEVVITEYRKDELGSLIAVEERATQTGRDHRTWNGSDRTESLLPDSLIDQNP